jgi:hypothetical protein
LIVLLAVGLVSLTTALAIARKEAYNQQESDDLSLKAETNADGAVFWPVINDKSSLQAKVREFRGLDIQIADADTQGYSSVCSFP